MYDVIIRPFPTVVPLKFMFEQIISSHILLDVIIFSCWS